MKKLTALSAMLGVVSLFAYGSSMASTFNFTIKNNLSPNPQTPQDTVSLKLQHYDTAGCTLSATDIAFESGTSQTITVNCTGSPDSYTLGFNYNTSPDGPWWTNIYVNPNTNVVTVKADTNLSNLSSGSTLNNNDTITFTNQ